MSKKTGKTSNGLFLCRLLLISCCCYLPFNFQAQSVTYKSFGDGMRVMAKDSTFRLIMGARFQTLYIGVKNLDTDAWSDQFLIRRLRLKFNGYALSPNLEYKIELGFSNRDTGGGQNPQSGFTSRIILDAVLKWSFHKDWSLWFGQTKLPGNRERVISSQNLQFVDRSLVNSRFNIDRDIGLQLRHEDKLGPTAVLIEAFSFSMGDGRDVISSNSGGYDYTFRLDFLPFGEFTDEGDYFSSDLSREEQPKLAIGVTYDFNDDAGKQRGQLGSFTIDSLGNYITNDLHTIFVDAIFKHKGISLQGEFAHKSAGEDIIVPSVNGSIRFWTGTGITFQGGYLFKNNFEVAMRYARVNPDSEVYSGITEASEYTIGLSRYLADHNLKLQTDFSFRDRATSTDFLQFRLQAEMAF